MRGVFKLPAYRRLLAAYGLNELAWSFGTLALAVLVYRRTGSATGTAGFFLTSQFLPALVSPALAARLDQRSPRPVLVALYVIEGIVYLVLARLAHRFSLAPVLALAFLDGVLAVTARGLARATTVSVLHPVGLLREGNAVTNTCFSISFMAGPAIAGAVVAANGTATALLVNCGLFVTIAVVLGTGALPGAPAERHPSAGRLRAALAVAFRAGAVRNMVVLQVAAVAFFTISVPVEVVLAEHTLHAGAVGYGALLSSWGAGAVAGSLLFARWRRRTMRALVTFSAGAAGAGLLVMAAAPLLGVAAVGAVIGGLGNGIETAAMQTAVQEVVEPRWMGMMMSVWESVNQATPGVGILLGGGLTALGSARIALAVAGAGGLAIVPVAWLALRPLLAVRALGDVGKAAGSRPSGAGATGR